MNSLEKDSAPWDFKYALPAGSKKNSPLELLDADGNPFAAYRYDEWGKPLDAGNHATGVWTQQTTDAQSNVVISADLAERIADRQILRYAGYSYDAESSLYYCSARYYDPLTCQFLTRDPVKADGEESAYQYCGGDPVGQSDSSGKYTLPNFTRVGSPRVPRRLSEPSPDGLTRPAHRLVWACCVAHCWDGRRH